MQKPIIINIDDQRDVLASLRKDLSLFEEKCDLIDCESAVEANEVFEELDSEEKPIAVIICDHIMPEQNGIDFLIEVNKDSRFNRVKKLLLTGMATHKDTIVAINMANIDRYIEKPWDKEELITNVKVLLTQYLVHSGMNYEPFLPILDQPTLYEELRKEY